jgi:hypothetical protein
MYTLLLVVHVLAAIALLGPTYLLPFMPKLVGTPAPHPAMQVIGHIERRVTLFVVVQLVTGLGLIFTDELEYLREDFGNQWWLWVSMVLFVVAAGIGTGFNVPRTRKALEASAAGDSETAAKLIEPMEKITGPLLGVIGTVIIVLMVWQPSL